MDATVIKRFLKTFLVLSLISTIGVGYGQGLEIEVFMRPALTSVRGNKLARENFDPTINVSSGIGVNFLLKGNSILNLAVLYDKRGGAGETTVVMRDDQNQTIAQGSMTLRTRFDYITIPIQWERRFGRNIRYQVGIGVYTGFLLKQRSTTEGFDGLGDSSQDDTDMYKRFDFGLSGSLKAIIPVTDFFSVKIGCDNNLGLFNVSSVPVMDDGSIKHNSLGLFAGLIFKVI